MSDSIPKASIDAPFLATTAEEIERLLSSSATPLDTVCGLLATDPALLLHLIRRVAANPTPASQSSSLRSFARSWLEASDHRWYSAILAMSHSGLSDQQRDKHSKLCRRSAVAAALLGEWSSQEVGSLREGADLAELRAVMAALPSLLQLCRIEAGQAYSSIKEELAAWPKELASSLNAEQIKEFQLPDDASDPAVIAVEVAAVAVSADAADAIARKLPEWARRLGRSAVEIEADLQHVEEGLQQLDIAKNSLDAEKILYLIRGESQIRKKELDCDGCRQQAYDNALATVRKRLSESEMGLVELVDHLMHAICNCGTLRRAHWYSLDGSRQFLQSRRRKTALKASVLESGDLSIAGLPMLQVLLERPRSIQVYPEIREQLSALLPQEVEDPFAEHYLCASVFCGTVPLGVLYADANGQQIGASEAAKFKAVAQLATKMASLLALRNHRRVDVPDTSQLAYPDYASFAVHTAANEAPLDGQQADNLTIRRSSSQ